MTKYSFAVPRFHIESNRSRNSDTLYASASLIVRNANGGLHQDYGSKGVSLGDHKDKETVSLNIPFVGVDVPDPTPADPDGGSVTWTFLLMNAGHVDSGYVAVLNKAADAFAGAAAGKVLDGGSLGPVIEILAGQEALNLLTANCDGMVGQGAFNYTEKNLSDMTHNKDFSTTIGNPGTDSPAGYGDNSKYDITFFIEKTPPPR